MLNEKLAAGLRLLEKLVKAPAQISSTDMNELVSLKVPKTAIAELVQLAAAFSLLNRVTITLGISLPNPRAASRLAWMLLHLGYH